MLIIMYKNNFIKKLWRSLGRIFSNSHFTNILLLVVKKAHKSALDNFIHTKKYTDTRTLMFSYLSLPTVGMVSHVQKTTIDMYHIEDMYFQNKHQLIFKFFLDLFIVCVCVHICQCACGCKRAYLGIQFYQMSSMNQTQIANLGSKHITCWAILPVLK